jgi:hypothetical protein
MPFLTGLIGCLIISLWVIGLIKGNEVACDWYGAKGNWFIFIYLVLSVLIADGIFNIITRI